MRFLWRCWIEWVTLTKKGILNLCTEFFLKQEREGIIEGFNVSPEQYGNYIQILHCPVIKDDDLTTPKIRPVFNCSLKVRNASSLNEAVYPGINLLNDFLDLLFYFRSDAHVFMADIRKVFLMIKLKSEVDKNRFCFFVREGENVVCFRFTTYFGFVASPFILNF